MIVDPTARFSTLCIHAGQAPDEATGAIITPLYQTSTYVQEGLGRHKGHEYARTSNPTRAAIEANVAALEGGTAGFGWASGMAAINAVLSLLSPGDHVVVTDNTYGGTYRLFERVLRKSGIDFTYVDTSDEEATRQAFTARTRMLFLETPTNPVLRLADIAALSAAAHAHGDVTVVVDNTFASPAVQQPLLVGADIVLHSTTKYLNGHSDSVGGMVVVKHAAHAEWLKFYQNAAGAILSAFDSWLILRGTKTLAVRMAAHNANGQAIAEYLAAHPKVPRVHYPGLPAHPQHALAQRQMRGYTGMVSFDAGTPARAQAVLERTRLFALAESLGGVESLISHPASMTHASVPPERRAALGVTDSLVRLSVGIEDVDDLKADLEQALAVL
ncbi:cystathionine beta-lyase [Luteitalea sp. TBR-22]|uniref:trans-sulfuration enzyme family protein n=1 Tax=Luteitalea sp. TBR-22 TaxID=2802971 RepID=UPI001AF532F3|nr:PLP-dependent aspartate aminotransferase family protein [Luteitalea sp. TBR-22]BCS33772.1 cystathionine beta-lyase [Luteitalea sp. TBR-22]